MDEVKANGSGAYLVESWLTPTESHIKSLWVWPDPEEVPLQIGIAGVAGTGKKRLAHQLGRRLELPVIHHVARTAKTMGFKLDDDSRWPDEFTIFLGQIWEQMEYPEFISAGTVIDIVAHAAYYVNTYGTKKDKVLLRALINCANVISNNDYTVVFYLPFVSRAKPDGVRSADATYLKEIDRLTHYYLDAFDLDYFPIKGDAKTKLELAHSYLEDFGLLLDRS